MAILGECPQCHKKQSVRNKVCACGKDLDKAKRAQKIRYWIDYIVPGTGKAKREPVAGVDDPKAYSVEEARAAEGKRKAQKVEAPRVLQRAPEERMTFKKLAEWYLGQEKVKALRYFPTLKINLASFNQEIGDTIVGQIKSGALENYQAKRKREGYSDAYVDRQIEAARAMINKAFDNDMVTGETVKVFRRVKKMLKRNSNARDRILAPEEFKGLMDKLPRHTKAILATGFYTGMRRGEVLSLTWDKVDMEKRMIRLEAEDTKDKEPRVIPILPELYEVLKATPRAIHVKCPKCGKMQPVQNKKCDCGEEIHPHVFLYRGKPVEAIKTGLIKACKDAGITYGRFVKDGFVFHDLRHSFNTYMRKAGVAQSVIMKITGHSTDEMFRRYNSIDAADAHQAIDQYGAFLRNLDQTLDQEGKTE
jgi:integrase